MKRFSWQRSTFERIRCWVVLYLLIPARDGRSGHFWDTGKAKAICGLPIHLRVSSEARKERTANVETPISGQYFYPAMPQMHVSSITQFVDRTATLNTSALAEISMKLLIIPVPYPTT